MRFFRSILSVIFIAALLASLLAATKPQRLFDGKSFKGWNGDLTIFRIENGLIVGGTLKEKLPRNEFLCTDKEYGDFVLLSESEIDRRSGICKCGAFNFVPNVFLTIMK